MYDDYTPASAANLMSAARHACTQSESEWRNRRAAARGSSRPRSSPMASRAGGPSSWPSRRCRGCPKPVRRPATGCAADASSARVRGSPTTGTTITWTSTSCARRSSGFTPASRTRRMRRWDYGLSYARELPPMPEAIVYAQRAGLTLEEWARAELTFTTDQLL